MVSVLGLALLLGAALPGQFMYVYGLHKTPVPGFQLAKYLFTGTALTPQVTWVLPMRTLPTGATQGPIEIDVEGRGVYLFYANQSGLGSEVKTLQETGASLTFQSSWFLPTISCQGSTYHPIDFAVDGGEILLLYQPTGCAAEVRRYSLPAHTYLGSILPPSISGAVPEEIDADAGTLYLLHKVGGNWPVGNWQLARITIASGAVLSTWADPTYTTPGDTTFISQFHSYLGTTMAGLHLNTGAVTLVGYQETAGGLVMMPGGAVLSPFITSLGTNYHIAELALDAGSVQASTSLYGTACLGSNGLLPTISAIGTPILGTTMTINLANAVPNTAGGIAYGFGSASVDLTPNGAPGCFFYNTQNSVSPIVTSGTGTASVPLTVPTTPALLGTSQYVQFGINDVAANPFGWVTTKGLQGTFGNY